MSGHVADGLRRDGPPGVFTAEDLARTTGLPLEQVASILRGFAKDGLVEPQGQGEYRATPLGLRLSSCLEMVS